MVVLGTNSFSFVFQSSLPSLERIGREKQKENTHTHVSRKKAQVNVAGMLIMNPGPGGCLVAWEIPTLAHVGNTSHLPFSYKGGKSSLNLHLGNFMP